MGPVRACDLRGRARCDALDPSAPIPDAVAPPPPPPPATSAIPSSVELRTRVDDASLASAPVPTVDDGLPSPALHVAYFADTDALPVTDAKLGTCALDLTSGDTETVDGHDYHAKVWVSASSFAFKPGEVYVLELSASGSTVSRLILHPESVPATGLTASHATLAWNSFHGPAWAGSGPVNGSVLAVKPDGYAVGTLLHASSSDGTLTFGFDTSGATWTTIIWEYPIVVDGLRSNPCSVEESGFAVPLQ